MTRTAEQRSIAELVELIRPDNEWHRGDYGKRRACTRDPKAGPGSCWFWWELCPVNVANCYQRWGMAQQAKETNSGDKKI